MAGSTARAARTTERTTDDVCIRIFEADFDYVYRSLIRMGVTPADAEDLAQEVFLVMWRRRADWDAGRPLRPWLFGVALRVAQEYRHRRGREAPVGIADRTDERPHAEEHLASTRAQALVLQAIATLPDKQRAVLILHEIEDMPMREVAEALSVPLFTAYTRLRTARRSFAKAVRRIELHRTGAPAPEAELLAEERNRMVPLAARHRVVERLRAILPTLPPPAPPAATSAWPLVLAAAAGVLAVAGLGALARPHGSRAHAALHDPRAPLRPSAAVAPGARPSRAGALSGEGLLGYWRFDDQRGSRVARDFSGSGNDCRLRRLDPLQASVGGVAGHALRFDGLGHLECGNPEAVEKISQSMTVAGWLKLDHRDFDLRAVLAWQRGHGNARFGLFFGLTGSKLLLASDVWGRVEAPLDDALGRWVHIAATHDDSGRSRLYVNGVEVAHNGGPAEPLGSGSNPFTVGGHIHQGEPRRITQRIHGSIDELVLFNRTLSSREIAELASDEAPLLLEEQLLSR